MEIGVRERAAPALIGRPLDVEKGGVWRRRPLSFRSESPLSSGFAVDRRTHRVDFRHHRRRPGLPWGAPR